MNVRKSNDVNIVRKHAPKLTLLEMAEVHKVKLHREYIDSAQILTSYKTPWPLGKGDYNDFPKTE